MYSGVTDFPSNQKTEFSRCTTDVGPTLEVVLGGKKKNQETFRQQEGNTDVFICHILTDGRRKYWVEAIRFSEERNTGINF